MGNKELNLAEPVKNKIYKNFENENIRVGICLMQGWRKTMEDVSLVLPNFDGNNSLFGVFDGHGGSIISEFVACNIGSILKNSKSYQKLNYEQSLIDSFVVFDDLLKNNKIDKFLKRIIKFKRDVKLNRFYHNGIIEISKSDINNDPNADYLFFNISSLEDDKSLKYQYPDLQQILNIKNETQNNKKIKYEVRNSIYANLSKTVLPNYNIIRKKSNSIHKSHSDAKITDGYIKKVKNSFIDNKNKNLENEIISDIEDINKESIKPKLEMCMTFKRTEKEDKTSLVANDIGTTANICLLKRNFAYIANVGDSLSVMYKKKKAYKLNKEHKTTMEKEYNRIRKEGGRIQNLRINGKMNITRTIGDLSYKNKNNNLFYEQDVICIPEVYKYPLDDVDFIVMGTDGFWDYGEDIQTICDNIYDEIKKNPKRDLCDLIGTMFDKALAKANNYLRGTDNMCCIIIQFLK